MSGHWNLTATLLTLLLYASSVRGETDAGKERAAEEDERNFCDDFQVEPAELLIGPIRLPAGTEVARKHDGPFTCIRLAEDFEINGAEYGKDNWLLIDSSGRVVAGKLAKEQTVRGIVLPAESSYVLNFKSENPYATDHLLLVTLSAEAVVGQKRWPAKATLYFDEAEKLAHVDLPHTTDVDGLPLCSSNKVIKSLISQSLLEWSFDEPLSLEVVEHECDWIDLYPDGAVQSGTLARNHNFHGAKLPAGSTAFFDESGKLQSISFFGQMVPFKGMLFVDVPPSFAPMGAPSNEDKSLSFYTNGQVASGYLAAATTIGGVRYAGLEVLEFHSNGRVARGTLAKNTSIQGRRFGAGDEVAFDERGRILSDK